MSSYQDKKSYATHLAKAFLWIRAGKFNKERMGHSTYQWGMVASSELTDKAT